LRADARFAHRSGAKVGVRVQEPLRTCLGCRSKSKKHDKQLTHIVRVMCCPDLLSYSNLGLFQVLFDRITFSRVFDPFIVNLILQGQPQLPEVRLSSSVQI
jgi:hypothetical protein